MPARLNTPRIPTKSDEMECNVPDLQPDALYEALEALDQCAKGQADRGQGEPVVALSSIGSLASFPPGHGPVTPRPLDKILSQGGKRGSLGEDDTNIHAFKRWQSLRKASASASASTHLGQPQMQGRHVGKLVVGGDSEQQTPEHEGLDNDEHDETAKRDELREDDRVGVAQLDVLQGGLHILDEKMDILLEVMFKNLKYSKAIYMSSKKSLTGPGHETGAVARVRFDSGAHETGAVAKARRFSANELSGHPRATLARQSSPLVSGQAEVPKHRERVGLRGSVNGDEKINNMLDLTRLVVMHQNEKSSWERVASCIWRCMEDRTSSKAAVGYFIGINCFLLFSIAFAITDVVSDSGNGSKFDRGGLAMALSLIIEISFTLEICLRFWVCPTRKVFWCNIFNIIDAASILPVVLRLLFLLVKPSSDVIYAIMCLVPALRLMKLLRRFETFHLLASAFRTSAEALPSILFMLMLVTLFFAAIIAYCEPRSNIPGYPAAVWYVIITLVGLAPSFPEPVTTAGKAWTVVLMLCGTLYMAIPIGIVGVAFSQVWEERQRLLILQRMRSCVERAGYSPKDLHTMFSLLDEDGDGTLDFQEFETMLEVMQIGVKEQFALEVFESFDSDCEGSIDIYELIQGLFPHAHWLLSQETPTSSANLAPTENPTTGEQNTLHKCGSAESVMTHTGTGASSSWRVTGKQPALHKCGSVVSAMTHTETGASSSLKDNTGEQSALHKRESVESVMTHEMDRLSSLKSSMKA